MGKQYYIYILRNHSGTFYIGVTNNLVRRLKEHKRKSSVSFTYRYRINMLIYYEVYDNPRDAIAREKQLKNWSRKKKIILITKMNPKFEEIIIDE